MKMCVPKRGKGESEEVRGKGGAAVERLEHRVHIARVAQVQQA